ncbi:MAG: peptidoglycan-binding protein [Clostridia bacterium]|nr:peptidoglycan-binding protein [Clostridia bacterium]
MSKITFRRLVAFVMAMILVLSVAATALAAYSTIPYGEQSNDVRKMQNALKKKGFYSGAVDGKFGPSTKSAVIKYQKYLGITADGKPGNKTLTALYEGRSAINKANNTELKNSITATNPRTLYYGQTGTRVKNLQRALYKAGVYKGSIDGVFGDLTLAAVKKYQYQVGLKADGLAGTKTLNSLYKKTGEKVGNAMLLDVGSVGAEVGHIKRFLTAEGYHDVPYGDGDNYSQALADVVKQWQKDQGFSETGAISENQYNKYVLGLD